MKILIDTNVIIDALTSREPWNESAEKIFFLAANDIVNVYITASSATDIYYLVRKHLHNADIARQIMSKLFSLVGILEVTEEDCVDALTSPIMDYEDALIEQVARRSRIEYIVTRNKKDYAAGLTKLFLPDEFIKFVEQKEQS